MLFVPSVSPVSNVVWVDVPYEGIPMRANFLVFNVRLVVFTSAPSNRESPPLAISSFASGVLVPIPTSPVEVIINGDVSGDVESSTTKEGPEPVLTTESLA